MIEKGDLIHHHHPSTHLRGAGLNLTRMSKALQPSIAEILIHTTDQNPNLVHIPKEALGQGQHQSPHHFLKVGQSPDPIPSPDVRGQHLNPPEVQPLD